MPTATETNIAEGILLRTEGTVPVFSAGWDSDFIDSVADDPMAMIANVVGPFCKGLRELPVPTISAVTGLALGFGFGLAQCCDLCIAEDNALFDSPTRHIGRVGAARFVEECDHMARRYGQRFEAPQALRDMAAANGRYNPI